MRPTSGLTFGGRYQLGNRIAIGGMGEVWQATDLVIGRTVAIKILKDEYLGDPGFLERFRAEARHAALVNHEGIANVFDYGEEDGSAFLVMELVPGEALSTILEREHTLPIDRVLDIVAQTASALQAAHQAGLVHRDIKPGNLLITPDGRVKITDFGIARIADQVPLTATGQVMGTVQYLSPEQASGHPASPSTDIYSLGIVAYECLAGRRPFTGESQVAIAMAQINEAPPELPITIAEPVRNLVYACIAKRPEDRPATAAHLARAAQALRRGDVQGAIAAVPGVAGHDPISSFASDTQAATRVIGAAGGYGAAGAATGITTTATETAPPARRRNPWMWPLIAIVGVLAVALIAIIIVLLVKPTDGAGPTPTGTKVTTPSTTPTTTPTPTSTTHVVESADYVGKPFTQVQASLIALGYRVNQQQGVVASTPDANGTVSKVNPTGPLPAGSEIQVFVFQDYPANAPAPSPPTGPQSGAAGASVPIAWPAYGQCPTGYALSGYKLTLTNATFATGNGTFPADGSNTAQIVLSSTASSATVTYVAICGSSGLQSLPSNALSIQITP